MPMAEPVRETWVATPEALGALAGRLRAAGRFAFDTEFVSEATFEPALCLAQAATADALAVIGPRRWGGPSGPRPNTGRWSRRSRAAATRTVGDGCRAFTS